MQLCLICILSGTTCAANNDGNGNSGISASNTTERVNDELTTVEENLHRLHIRFVYDEHRNDLVVNIIEGRNLRRKINFYLVLVF